MSYGITIVLVAHDIPLVMEPVRSIQVLNYGRLIAEGDPASGQGEPRRHRRVPRAGSPCLSCRPPCPLRQHPGIAGCLADRSLPELVALIGSNGAGKSTSCARSRGPPAIGRDDLVSKGRHHPRSDRPYPWPSHLRTARRDAGSSRACRSATISVSGPSRQRDDRRSRLTSTWCSRSSLAQGAVAAGRRNAVGREQQMLAIGRALMSRPRLLAAR